MDKELYECANITYKTPKGKEITHENVKVRDFGKEYMVFIEKTGKTKFKRVWKKNVIEIIEKN